MARIPIHFCFIFSRFIYVLAAFLLSMVLLFAPSKHAMSDNADNNENLVKQLISQGLEEMVKTHWLKAAEYYKKARELAKEDKLLQLEVDALFALLEVYQLQLNSVDAFNIAKEIENLAVHLNDEFSIVRSYRLLGISYQAVAQNELARDYFAVAAETARHLKNPSLLAQLLNELGYADVLLLDYRSAYNTFDESYQVSRSINDKSLMLLALINKQRSAIALGNKRVLSGGFSRIEKLINEIGRKNQVAGERISLGTLYRSALIKLKLDKQLRKKAFDQYQQALKTAKKQNDLRLESLALGYLGQIYSDEGQYETAETYSKQALEKAQKFDLLTLLYRWQLQLARIYRASRERDKAINYYYQTLETQKRIGLKNFLRYERSYSDDIKPVYEELLQLTFQKLETMTKNKNTWLKEIINYVQQFKQAEIEAFCLADCQFSIRENKDDLNQGNAVLIPLSLEDELHVLLITQAGITHQKQNVAKTLLRKNVIKIQQSIFQNNKNYLSSSKKLYKWLIAPFSQTLVKNNVQSLSVVAMNELMEIPFVALYDGKHYLIENYDVTLTAHIHEDHSGNLTNGSMNLLGKFDDVELSNAYKNRLGKLFNAQSINFVEDAVQIKKLIHDNNSNVEILTRIEPSVDYRKSKFTWNDYPFSLTTSLGKLSTNEPISLVILNSSQVDNLLMYANSQILNAKFILLNTANNTKQSSNFKLFFLKELKQSNNVKQAYRKTLLHYITKGINDSGNWASFPLISNAQ